MNNPSVIQLQREAAQRVRNMEERSRRLVREHPVKIYRGTALTPQPPQPPRPLAPICEEPIPPVCDEPIVEEAPSVCEEMPIKNTPPCLPKKANKGGALSFLCGDSERTLLILLAVVLWQNGAPPELLLALLYVAL